MIQDPTGLIFGLFQLSIAVFIIIVLVLLISKLFLSLIQGRKTL